MMASLAAEADICFLFTAVLLCIPRNQQVSDRSAYHSDGFNFACTLQAIPDTLIPQNMTRTQWRMAREKQRGIKVEHVLRW